MNFYIDFEATQPQNEIIAIGVISEKGDAYKEYVKPQFSSVSHYITELTNISNEQLEEAKDFDSVMCGLYDWCASFEPAILNWHFYAYGDDTVFVRATTPNVKTEKGLIMSGILAGMIRDFSKDVSRYFRAGTSLINAFSYFEEGEFKQVHDPLIDAIMLKDVFDSIIDKEPLDKNPLSKKVISKEEMTYIFPSGKFYCWPGGQCRTDKNTISFKSITDALNWLKKTAMKNNDAEPHLDRLSKNIMKAIRKRTTYCGYYWTRIK